MRSPIGYPASIVIDDAEGAQAKVSAPGGSAPDEGEADSSTDAVGEARAGRSAATPVFAIGAAALMVAALFLVALLFVVVAYLVGG